MPDDVDPRWRTSTVIDLCKNLRATRDWHVLPILADALMDAGCDDEELLNACRNPSPKDVANERIVALVYSRESATAVRRIEQLAESMGADGAQPGDNTEPYYGPYNPMTYERIMEGAGVWLAAEAEAKANGEDYFWEGITQRGSDDWRSDFPAVAAEFWRNYATVTGADTEGRSDSFFSCSC